MPISDELKRIYTGYDTQTKIIEVLQIYHAVAGDYWIANWPEQIEVFQEGTGDSYEPTPGAFTLTQPGQSAGGRSDMTITLANADGQADSFIDAILASDDRTVACTYRIYLENDLSAPQIDPPLSLRATSISRSGSAYVISCGRKNTINMPWPRTVYRTSGAGSYPGLLRG